VDKNKITKQDVVRVLNVIGIITSRLADLIDELANSKPQEEKNGTICDRRSASMRTDTG
jgi:hypothetical protein